MRVVSSVVLLAVLVTTAVFAAGDTRLVTAVKAGDSATALALLAKKADPNAGEPDGTTPLHWAIRNDDAALAERLLRAGANGKAANRYGITPIALACESGNAAIVERLLKAGVSANTTGPLGETALHTCARAGKTAAAKVLIAHGATLDVVESWRGQTPLMWAAAEGHPDTMRMLIEAGADVHARSALQNWERQRTLEPRDKWLPPGAFTPLLFAAREGCVECVKVLAAAKADVNAVDAESQTGLILALINGHVDVAAELIRSGIDVNMADRVGRTGLYAAVDLHTVPASNRPAPRETDDSLSSLDVIRMLLDRGANPDAALRAQLPYRTKLDRGGDGALGAGTTPLLRAAKAGDAAVIKLLLDKGANAKAATRNGVNGIMMAANVATREEDMTGRSKTQKDAVETITLLAASGADINASDTQGRTALHGAALWGLNDVVRLLHQKGANINAPDKRGLHPLDAAMGLSGGFGFDGTSGVARPDTAALVKELGGVPGKLIPQAPGGRGGRGGAAADPQDQN
jgi:ankyrin repeat protein